MNNSNNKKHSKSTVAIDGTQKDCNIRGLLWFMLKYIPAHLMLLTVLLIEFFFFRPVSVLDMFVLPNQMNPAWWSATVFAHSTGFRGAICVGTQGVCVFYCYLI
jgi:hypothetical protein